MRINIGAFYKLAIILSLTSYFSFMPACLPDDDSSQGDSSSGFAEGGGGGSSGNSGSGTSSLPEGSISFKTIKKTISATCGSAAETKLITNEDDWRDAYSGWFGVNKNSPDIPFIDFTQKTVLYTLSGQKLTNGYSITIKSIESVSGKLEVVIEEVSPGTNCIVASGFTCPIHIVEISGLTTQTIVEKKTSIVDDCK